VLNSFADDLARLLVRPDQNGCVVDKIQHDIRSSECCRIIQSSGLKVGQQAAQPKALKRGFGRLVELSGTIVRDRFLDLSILAKDEASVQVNPPIALVVITAEDFELRHRTAPEKKEDAGKEIVANFLSRHLKYDGSSGTVIPRLGLAANRLIFRTNCAKGFGRMRETPVLQGFFGSGRGTRTPDPRIMIPVL
jgi:hypothetical protein